MKNLISLVVLFAFIFCSCGKDEDYTTATMLDLREANIYVSESKDHINIRVESLRDSIDNRTEAYPSTDFCTIGFDLNNNGEADRDIDFGYSSPTSNYDICSFYFRDSITISPCGEFSSQASFDHDFASSDIQSTPHPIWNLSIPKKDFDGMRSIHFVVKIYEPGLYQTYPESRTGNNSARIDFARTFLVEW